MLGVCCSHPNSELLVHRDVCYVCRSKIEHRIHLFFECSFPSQVWRKISGDCLADTCIKCRDGMLDWIISLNGEGFRIINSCLARDVSIYYLWLARNASVWQK